MLFDTHTHFNFNAFKDDWKEVIERALEQSVWFVNVGAEAKTSQRAVEIAAKYPTGVYAAVGLHPIHTYDDKFEEVIKGEKVKFVTKAEEFDKDYYSKLVNSSPKVVAVGESGLDYFHIKKFSPALRKKLKQKQVDIFIEQVKLASDLNKPIIIHCRPDKDFDAYKEILEILKSSICHSRKGGNPDTNAEHHINRLDPRASLRSSEDDNHAQKDHGVRGIVHCFQGNEKILEEFLALGFMIGYNGVITFTSDYDGLVKATPLPRIVLETDAPWLAPVPHRGQRNESTYVEYVAKRIAEIKRVSFEKVAKITTGNAIRVFNIKTPKTNSKSQ